METISNFLALNPDDMALAARVLVIFVSGFGAGVFVAWPAARRRGFHRGIGLLRSGASHRL